MNKCYICNCEIKGYGNNPNPLVKDVGASCCDKCNQVVITYRIALAETDLKNKKLIEKFRVKFLNNLKQCNGNVEEFLNIYCK